MARVAFAGTRQDVDTILRKLPAILAGKSPDVAGVGQALQLRCAMALLSKIKQAFIAKSRGGTGEDGIRWKPLKRETIAQRRVSRSAAKGFGITGKRERGLLTPAQNTRWKKIFGSRKAMFMAKYGMGEGEAAAMAAKIAWTMLKEEGAMTKLAVLGGRQVDILRDTAELLRSLSPAVDVTRYLIDEGGGRQAMPTLPDGQIIALVPGRIAVGTNKKTWHHRGTSKLPARPFWPLSGMIPPKWWAAVLLALRRGIVVEMARLLSAGKGKAP